MCVAQRSASTDRAAHGPPSAEVAGDTPTSCHEPCHAAGVEVADPVGPMVHSDPRRRESAELLDRRIYGKSQVARLLGLRTDGLRRWIGGYERQGKVYAPVIREGTTGIDHHHLRWAAQTAVRWRASAFERR
jgi:hypothetical protein